MGAGKRENAKPLDAKKKNRSLYMFALSSLGLHTTPAQRHTSSTQNNFLVEEPPPTSALRKYFFLGCDGVKLGSESSSGASGASGKVGSEKMRKNKFKHCSCGPGVVRLSPSGRRLQLLWQWRKKKKEYENHQRRNRDSVGRCSCFRKMGKLKIV